MKFSRSASSLSENSEFCSLNSMIFPTETPTAPAIVLRLIPRRASLKISLIRVCEKFSKVIFGRPTFFFGATTGAGTGSGIFSGIVTTGDPFTTSMLRSLFGSTCFTRFLRINSFGTDQFLIAIFNLSTTFSCLAVVLPADERSKRAVWVVNLSRAGTRELLQLIINTAKILDPSSVRAGQPEHEKNFPVSEFPNR